MKQFFYCVLTLSLLLNACTDNIPADFTEQGTALSISPDYTQLTIPYNIAPLNFTVNDPADVYLAVAHSSNGKQLTTTGPKVMWKLKEWKALLETNKGKTLSIDFYLKKGEQWYKYPSIRHFIAEEAIDPYLSYRLIEPGYVTYEDLSINQRNLTNFEEKIIFSNTSLGTVDKGQCINCHSYQNYNKTGNMQFHVRQYLGGTVIVQNGQAKKINLKTDYTISGGVYPSWHPTLNLIAYSVNDTYQNFHTKDAQKIEVMDKQSGLILYDVAKDEVRTIANDPRQFETFPYWSADGKFLYYASATLPEGIQNPEDDATLQYKDFYYNLYRKAFNPETYEFTYTDTIFEASEFKKSATFPRESPDGRYLLFTLGEYGNFHIWHKSSDLYLLDLQSWELRNLTELNSKDVESYHSWSSNGHWIVFSSRRDDGSYTRPYIAYFKDGKAGKPFILPQENPDFYGEFFKSYNIPEFMAKPVTISRQELMSTIKKEAQKVNYLNTEKGKVVEEEEREKGKENIYQ
ncbi:cytochrome c biosynthesis protein [Bacteroidia bacterium]|nr:cytochrome c biosynthesis protein [Bacteroidia bacterium]